MPELSVEPLELEPLPVAPLLLDPDADGELVELDVDGELIEPDADGELVELDVDGELIEPDVDGELVEPLAPDPTLEPEPMLELDPEVLEPDVLGDAAGDWLSETPAACIACWLQRSKSERLSEPPPAVAATGSMRAPIAADANTVLSVILEPPEVSFQVQEAFKSAAIEHDMRGRHTTCWRRARAR